MIVVEIVDQNLALLSANVTDEKNGSRKLRTCRKVVGIRPTNQATMRVEGDLC